MNSPFGDKTPERKPRQILGMNNQSQVDQRMNSISDSISSNQNLNMDRLRLSNLFSQDIAENSLREIASEIMKNIDSHNLAYVIHYLNQKPFHQIIADFHPLWSYGQFSMPPVCPPPGLAMFQSPSLPYPLPVYQSSNIPTNLDSNLQSRLNPNSSGSTGRGNEPNNVLVQIGLQSVNQNNPVNINSLNDLSFPVIKPISDSEINLNNLDSSTSGSSPNSLSERNNFDSSLFNKEYEKKFGFDEPEQLGVPTLEADRLSRGKFSELTRLAMRGSELAERLAYTHRNRPCFKKIDSLCARMKQDLIRPDGVLPNINSQGIAWAVKDFIFVFTRVINAWIIIKGYVYNTPEGLNKVKAALSPDFIKSFAAWQDTTMDFVENLIKSFVSLDQLVQSQKAAFQKMDNLTKNTTSTPVKTNNAEGGANGSKLNMFEDPLDFLNNSTDSNITSKSFSGNDNCAPLNKSYFSTLIEDSEETQRKATANGTYFKTGVYNPLQKESTDIDALNIGKKEIIEPSFDQHLVKSMANISTEDINLFWPNALLSSCATNFYNPSPINGEGDGKQYAKNLVGLEAQNKSNDWLPYELRVLENNLSKFSQSFDPSITKPIGVDLTEKLEILLDRISNLSEGKYFFTAHFTRNYFSDFTAKYPNFMDLRSIILKAQVGGYGHIFEIVHDLKLIIYLAKIYLKTNQNDLLKYSIAEYEKEIDNILKEKIFINWTFDHITGDPNENVYTHVRK